ncbi:MAG: DNA alkylation repair protein [Elusimicrobia bacterium]|nr:DNA alkylation repair protein [Candidatus Liberimonas magnetica]
MNRYYELIKELEGLKNPGKAKLLSSFFKTGKGEYGEGDVFLGITLPEQRIVYKKYLDLGTAGLKKLLSSGIHEHRLVALLILVENYKRSGEANRKKIAEFYIKNKKGINNWDLVDLSAPSILGHYFFNKDKSLLYNFARSKNLWAKRIAVLSSFYFIRNREFKDALKISAILLHDKHDLIHKAVGWMLRELGKRDIKVEESFLKKYYKTMPRTMLRYAIEKFAKDKKLFYMTK